VRYTYAVVDQRKQSEKWFYSEAAATRLPDHATCVLYDNEKDPWQNNPIFPGQGYADVIEQHHHDLKAWLESVQDDFLETIWKETRP